MGQFERWGLRQVINASGKMTALGASAVHPEVGAVLAAAAGDYVVIEELYEAAGERIAKATGAAFAVPTIGAASGIAISVAACIAGTDIGAVELLPLTTTTRTEIVLPKGHAVHFGGSIIQMMRIGGGVPVEAGHANLVTAAHIESAINERTAALFYCKSHHAVQKGMVSLADLIKIGHKHDLPVIVDAAAEEDLKKYVAMGADLVLYSGGKAIGGPTAGFIAGTRKLVEACVMQYKGVGRAMKVSKEAVAGLLAAIERYEQRDMQADALKDKARMEWLVQQLATVQGVKARITQDEAGRAIYRCSIEVLPESGLTAAAVVAKMEAGNPAIYTRNHQVNLGIINVDPRPMLPGQEEILLNKLVAIVKEG